MENGLRRDRESLRPPLDGSPDPAGTAPVSQGETVSTNAKLAVQSAASTLRDPTIQKASKYVGVVQPLKVICPLHGIRTCAKWQKGLADLAHSQDWACRLERWSYGQFSLIAFLVPWTRESKLNWLRQQYDTEIHDRRLDIEKGQTPSVVAHSFGTYILGYTLLRFDFIRFNKVILCGSILPPDFPWDKLIERGQIQALRNEYGVRDPWVKRVCYFVRGTGPSGASGFTCRHERFEQEEFEYYHSDYFGHDHIEDRWLPFLNKPLDEIPRAASDRIPRPQTSWPWGLYVALLALVLFATAIVVYLARHPDTGVSAAVQGPNSHLHGVVFSIEDGQGDRKYLPDVQVTLVGFKATGKTDNQGAFRIPLPASVRPGQDITLQEDQEDYYILLPVLSQLRLPASAAPGVMEPVVEIWMAPKGSKVVLGADFIEQFISYAADDSAQKIREPKGRLPDLSSYISEFAKQSGFQTEEILGQVSRWVAQAKESDDPRKLGLAAFAEKKFRVAAESFGRAADAEKRRGAEGFRRSAADRALEGSSFTLALDFEKALQTYWLALGDLEVYGRSQADLGLSVYPGYVTDIAKLEFKIAAVKSELGIRIAGSASRRNLEEAIQSFRKLIAQCPKASKPRLWAMIQAHLGNTLANLGERQGGMQGIRQLGEAIEAYYLAFTVFSQNDFPKEWAIVQSNLGGALRTLGKRQRGMQGVRQLGEAVRACRLGLAVFSRDADPEPWAAVQITLANTLKSLGECRGGSEGLRHLQDAVEACRQALAVFSHDAHPQQWATVQLNLGCTLSSLGERYGGPESLQYLQDAEAACRQALAVFSRDAYPQQWAMAQIGLANTLKSLGDRRGGSEGLRQLQDAVESYHLVLVVHTYEDFPEDWATAQGNLGNTFRSLGERRAGPEGLRHLQDAAEAYRLALTVYTRAADPQHWAMAQINLGNILTYLCERENVSEWPRYLREAVEASRLVLAVCTREADPELWAMAETNLGSSLRSLGERRAGPEGLRHLQDAAEAYRLALTVYTRAVYPQYWAMAQISLGSTFMSLGKRCRGSEGLRYLRDAVEAYRLALTVYTRTTYPQHWAMALGNLGLAVQIQVRWSGFAKGLEQFGLLRQADGLRDNPVAQASLQTLAIVCYVATGQKAEANRAFTDLVELIQRQKDNFRLAWDWALLSELVTESRVSELSACRESLKKLINAVGRDNKAEILAGLEEVQNAFTTQSKSPRGLLEQ